MLVSIAKAEQNDFHQITGAWKVEGMGRKGRLPYSLGAWLW